MMPTKGLNLVKIYLVLGLLLGFTACKTNSTSSTGENVLVSGTVAPYEAASFSIHSSSADAVHVRFISTIDDSVVAETDSDENNHYSVTIPSGTYVVEFSRTDFRTRRFTVEVGDSLDEAVDGILLSRPAEMVGASVGNKILFAGGDLTVTGVDIIDTVAGTSTLAALSDPRLYISSATSGDNVYFVGGFKDVNGFSSKIDVYNSVSESWTDHDLLQARQAYGVGIVGSKMIVPGGFSGGANARSDIEIVDLDTWAVTTRSLSVARAHHSVSVVGNKVYIAGGVSCWTSGCTSNTIDVYDVVADSITQITMPSERSHHQAVIYGTKIYFAGGEGSSTAVDILETADNSWTSTTIPVAPGASAVSGVIGDRLFFAGGSSGVDQYVSAFSLYDVAANTWTSLSLSEGRYNMGVAVSGDKVYMAGGNPESGEETDIIEIFNNITGGISIF
jgi:hypothetical protein